MTKKAMVFLGLVCSITASAQLGHRFPSERKVIKDPKTGVELVFLTSTNKGDSKTYPTHSQWTADGKWCIFNSKERANGEAIAVNEETGDIVQVTEGSYTGKLLLARKSMKMYYLRTVDTTPKTKANKAKKEQTPPNPRAPRTYELVELDLTAVFTDSEKGSMKKPAHYERVCGQIPAEMGAGGDITLDANEDVVYFKVGRDYSTPRLPEGTKPVERFGPKYGGVGPSGIVSLNVLTGELKDVVFVAFETGHVQANPWMPGEVVFCWETGGKAPQRTWAVNADGSNLRPVYRETEFDWVTHEAVISKDEVAMAILGHRPIQEVFSNQNPNYVADPLNPGQEPGWGPSGTREKATGLAIVNLRTREFTMAGQIPFGSGFWHVNGSSDGHWAAGDNFSRDIYLIDRHTGELILLSAGHKETAKDHPHPTFSADGTKIHIQSAMLSEDGVGLNICVIKIPQYLLDRYK